jgi:hypothetical protein
MSVQARKVAALADQGSRGEQNESFAGLESAVDLTPDSLPFVGRMAEAFARSMVPRRRARNAGTGSTKKIQAWAPLPDRERSIATDTPAFWAAPW